MKPVSEQTIFISGATDGLGKMLASRLAGKGAFLLLHGRSREKGEAVVEELKKSSGNNKIEYYNADLSSLKSILALSEELSSKHNNIDLLINNAAIGGGPKSAAEREFSRDGYELRFAVNYLAQVLMTQQLLPLVKEKGSRIVNVSSIGQSPVNFEDIMMEHDYDGYKAYTQSKLALIMYTFDLAEELKGKGITVNAMHPATLMNTNMVEEHFGRTMATVEEGTDALEYVAASPELDGVTGEYFDGKQKAKADNQAYDKSARAQLKEITEHLITQAL